MLISITLAGRTLPGFPFPNLGRAFYTDQRGFAIDYIRSLKGKVQAKERSNDIGQADR
jgi:hypothetical protein